MSNGWKECKSELGFDSLHSLQGASFMLVISHDQLEYWRYEGSLWAWRVLADQGKGEEDGEYLKDISCKQDFWHVSFLYLSVL